MLQIGFKCGNLWNFYIIFFSLVTSGANMFQQIYGERNTNYL